MTTSRRAVIGAAAALAGGCAINAAAIVAVKAATNSGNLQNCADPIFALLEQYRVQFDAIEADGYGSSESEQWRLHAEVRKLNDLEEQILQLPFTTPAGIAAGIRFLLDHVLSVHDFDQDSDGVFLRRVADAVERKAVAA